MLTKMARFFSGPSLLQQSIFALRCFWKWQCEHNNAPSPKTNTKEHVAQAISHQQTQVQKQDLNS